MFMKYIDYISPKITFYHKGLHRHSTLFGGILTLIMSISVLSLFIKYFSAIISREKCTSIFYTKYENDTGYFPLNSSSLFQIIRLHKDNTNLKIDFGSLRIILISKIYEDYEYSPEILENTEHWVYDNCDENDINYFNNEKHKLYSGNLDITNALCIKYYYNSTDKKYYSIKNDTNNKFIWPYLQHGLSNRNNVLLATFIEKCYNNSITNQIFGKCNTEEKINSYLNQRNHVKIELIDNQVDLNNLSTPLQLYFYELSTEVMNDDHYFTFNLYYRPLLFQNKQDYLFGGFDNTNSFIFHDYKIISSLKKNNENILVKYTYWMQNYKDIYQRKYESILDLFQSVGGITQFIYYFLYYVNYLYNRYILMINTQKLYLGKDGSIHVNKKISIHNKKSSNIKNIKSSLNKKSKCISISRVPDIVQSKPIKEELREKLNKKKNSHGDASINLFLNNKSNNHLSINYAKVDKLKMIDDDNIIQNNQLIFHSDKNNKNYNFFGSVKYFLNNNTNNIENNYSIDKKNKTKYLSISDENSKNFSKYFFHKSNNEINVNCDKEFHSKKNRRITLLDVLNNENHPMLGYFNLHVSKKGIEFTKFFEEKITFLKYLQYLCSFKSKKCNINIFEKFHQKLLSEEFLYHSHILLYILHQEMIERRFQESKDELEENQEQEKLKEE